MITRGWLSDWLKKIGQDRNWLATQIGVSKRTIDNWYARDQDVPLTVQLLVRRIASDLENDQVKFSTEDFKQIQAAMKLTLHESEHQFIVDAAKKRAAEVVHQQRQSPPDSDTTKSEE